MLRRFQQQPKKVIIAAASSATAAAGGLGYYVYSSQSSSGSQQHTPESPPFTTHTLTSISNSVSIPLSVHAATAEMQGRRRSMEDAHFTFLGKEIDKSGNKHKISLFGILDGHGGDIVANKASQYLPDTLFDHPLLISNPGKAFVESILQVDDKLFHEKVPSGACSVSALLNEDKRTLTVANLGDCQAFVCEGKDKAVPLSVEHKPDAPVERARIEGRLGGKVRYQGSHRPGRYKVEIYRVGRLSLSRAFGDFDHKGGDKSPSNPELLTGKEYRVSNIADIMNINVSDETKYLVMGCDGLFDVMMHDDVVWFVNKFFNENKSSLEKDVNGTLKQAAEALIKRAYDVGSGDNISATIVLFHDPKNQKYG